MGGIVVVMKEILGCIISQPITGQIKPQLYMLIINMDREWSMTQKVM